MATAYKTKEDAIEKADQLNESKGFILWNPIWVGPGMAGIFKVAGKGWYLKNKESGKMYAAPTKPANKIYHTIINGMTVQVTKRYRTKTQYEYFIRIFYSPAKRHQWVGNYHQGPFLRRKDAHEEAVEALTKRPQPRIERLPK